MDVPIAELSGPAQWAVLGVAVLGTGIVLFRPKFKKPRDPLARSPQSASLAQHRSVEREMQKLLVELSEMSRQITASLDTRAAKLDELIREADQKIAELTSLRTNGSQSNQPPARNEFMTERAMLFAPAISSAPAMSSGGGELAGPVSERATEPEGMSTTMPSPQNPSPYDIDPRHAEVYQLADQGQTAAEIAAQLQRPHGEIQLILALRPH